MWDAAQVLQLPCGWQHLIGQDVTTWIDRGWTYGQHCGDLVLFSPQPSGRELHARARQGKAGLVVDWLSHQG